MRYHTGGLAIDGGVGDRQKDVDLVNSLGRSLGDLQPSKVPSQQVATLGGLIRSELMTGADGYVPVADALVEAMFIGAVREAPRSARRTVPKDPRVSQYIHESYADPIQINDLARVARTSRFHLSRMFRRELGQSPYQYLLQVRLSKAAELLRVSGQGVTEVAFAVGFLDLGRFARAFRARWGESPGAYSKKVRGMGVGFAPKTTVGSIRSTRQRLAAFAPQP